MQKRAGKTEITSVSVSKEFKRLLEIYGLSPSDVFRKGIAVSLCDLEVEEYETDLNKKRSKVCKEFLNSLKELEPLKKRLKELNEAMEKI